MLYFFWIDKQVLRTLKANIFLHIDKIIWKIFYDTFYDTFYDNNRITDFHHFGSLFNLRGWQNLSMCYRRVLGCQKWLKRFCGHTHWHAKSMCLCTVSLCNSSLWCPHLSQRYYSQVVQYDPIKRLRWGRYYPCYDKRALRSFTRSIGAH